MARNDGSFVIVAMSLAKVTVLANQLGISHEDFVEALSFFTESTLKNDVDREKLAMALRKSHAEVTSELKVAGKIL
jgi:hypothetical protein